MIRAVTVENDRGEELRLELRNPDRSGIMVVNVEGLGPPMAVMATSSLPMYDGESLNSVRIDKRNITMDLVFMEAPTIEDVRRMTYRYFPIGKPVALTVETKGRTGRVVGYVESNEPVIFSSQEYTRISVLCPESYFEDYGEGGGRSEYFYGIEPMFEFPFENDSLTSKELIMGSYSNVMSREIVYDGDAETGVVITAEMRGAVNGLTVHNPVSGVGMTINHNRLSNIVPSGLILGDIVTIDTRRRSRSIKLLRGGVEYNILDALVGSTSWLTLKTGHNTIEVTAVSGITNLRVDLEYRELFEGV